MSKLEKLFGKEKNVKIGELDLMFEPLGVEHLDLFLELEDKDIKVKAEAAKKIVLLTLQKSVPEATKEELNRIGIKYFGQIQLEILKLNGFGEEEE